MNANSFNIALNKRMERILSTWKDLRFHIFGTQKKHIGATNKGKSLKNFLRS